MMKARGLFITGTDTGIGKTHVSIRLLHVLQGFGLRVAGMKPVASGAKWQTGQWVNDDALALRAASSLPLAYQQVNPYVFEPPVAPHLAAEESGERVDLERIHQTFLALADGVDCVIVEGVGGWRVPLNADEDVSDLARALGLPVVLVVGLRLGCISHARLTHESIMASGLVFGGWIANQIEADLPRAVEIIATLTRALGHEPLAELAFHLESDGPDALKDHWNRCEILRLVEA
jgi:dethiobiotin synthetase